MQALCSELLIAADKMHASTNDLLTKEYPALITLSGGGLLSIRNSQVSRLFLLFPVTSRLLLRPEAILKQYTRRGFIFSIEILGSMHLLRCKFSPYLYG